MPKRSRKARGKTLQHVSPTWLRGSKVQLRTIEPADVRMLQRWINTSPAREWVMPRFPFSEIAEQEWAARAAVSADHPAFVIQTLDGTDIGVIGLIIQKGRATLGIAIHEDQFWSNGYGTDAMQVMVDGAFRVLPLARVELMVYPENARAVRCYEKVGFKHEGVLRSYEWGHGRWRDVLMMSILYDEWRELTERRAGVKRLRAQHDRPRRSGS